MRAMWTVILLLPACVAAESHVESAAGSAPASATARVEFKIVIPAILYLQVADGGAGKSVAATLVTNSRHMSAQHLPCALDASPSRLICTAAVP